jgi:hypothetical protein
VNRESCQGTRANGAVQSVFKRVADQCPLDRKPQGRGDRGPDNAHGTFCPDAAVRVPVEIALRPADRVPASVYVHAQSDPNQAERLLLAQIAEHCKVELVENRFVTPEADFHRVRKRQRIGRRRKHLQLLDCPRGSAHLFCGLRRLGAGCPPRIQGSPVSRLMTFSTNSGRSESYWRDKARPHRFRRR